MPPSYSEVSPARLARLAEANLEAFVLALSHNAGAESIMMPEVTWYSDETIVSPMFNGVVHTDCSPSLAERMIDITLEYFIRRERPLVFWWVGTSNRPADLGARLLARGLAAYEIDAPSMAADLELLPDQVDAPQGFSIEIVHDADSAQEWADTFNTIYETPHFAGQAWAESLARFDFEGAPYRMYLGRLHGRPVATNILFCGAGVASVFGVGTLRETRGQGIGTAITLRPYLDAREQGYHTGVLFATDEGAPVYRRLGFREVGTISRYLWQANRD